VSAKGKFRRDLAYALGTLTIVLPPLAKRREDIPLLAQHFLEESNTTREHQLSGFAPAAMELLAGLLWPGNIDELAKAVREACQGAAGPQVTLADLPRWVHLAKGASGNAPRRHEPIQIDTFLAEIEKELMVRALGVARGNKSKAAQLLGISRPRLLRRLAQLGLIAPPAIEEPVVFEPLPEEPI
jgi:DNA-binding NtrC family response regulator